MTANYEKTNVAATPFTSPPEGKARLNIPVTLFRGVFGDGAGQATLGEIFRRIVEPNEDLSRYSQRLYLAKQQDEGEYDQLKEGQGNKPGCPAFVIGKFSGRKNHDCEEYIPLLGFDIDAVDGEDLIGFYLEECKKSPFIFAAYPSPSGQGLRLFVWCNSTPDTHKKYYNAICQHLSEVFSIPTDKALRQQFKAEGLSADDLKTKIKQNVHIDTGTNNLARLWFYTAVPGSLFYVNENSQVFVLKATRHPTPQKKKSRVGANVNGYLSDDEKVEICRDKVERQNIPGGRNNYVFALACELCKHGLPESRALSECLPLAEPHAAEPFTESEVKKSVRSAYNSHKREFSDGQIMKYKRMINGEERAENNDTPPEPEPEPGESEPPEKKPEAVDKPKFIKMRDYLDGKYDFRLNVISLELETSGIGKNEWKELNENDLICELLEAGLRGVEAPLMALLRSSFVPKYNPFEEYVDSLPEWQEGDPDYIEDLANYVDAKDQYWFNMQFKKMLVRVLACALGKIPFNKQCFTIKGNQNDGKSTFLRFLCPPKLRNYITDHIDVHNKDGRLALCQNLFINLDELATFNRAEIKKTKALFTIDKVKERLPYDRRATNHDRRASFLGSTNEDEFLIDETGNVRWLVFEIDGIQHDNGGPNGYVSNVDIDLVYAQAYALLKTGFDFRLSREELEKSERNNKGYQVTTTEMELIQRFFEKADKEAEGAEFLTATDILTTIETHTKSRLSKVNVGKSMTIMGFEKSQVYDNERGFQRKGYFVKRREEIESH